MDILLPVLFFLVAAVYSVAGFGGASTYLALMVVAGRPFALIAAVALICNVIVTGGSVLQFARARLLPLSLVLPLLVFSVPAAFLGGLVVIDERVAKMLLALCLLVASGYMLNYHRFAGCRVPHCPDAKRVWMCAPLLGGGIGFVSGLVGIGGGIFLAPVLYVLGWLGPRQVAAASCMFILVNSLAGLGGQAVKTPLVAAMADALPLFVAVFLGGQVGSVLSAVRLRPATVQVVTAVLILIASLRIAWATVG